jgi:succinoglycan biosynthesis transport protein ExoP
MTQAPESLRPYGDTPPPERSAGGSPHLSDYWQVVSRRLWLVLLVFGVTTASAIWAVSRQRIYYQAALALQVNDPAQPARGLVAPGRVSGIDIFVDPIESEIQVLRSTPIAAAVVDSLGLRLKPASSDRVRSDLFRDVRVTADAPDGRFELVYDAAGRTAELRTLEGAGVATATVGSRMETPFASFLLQPAPAEERSYPVDLVATGVAAGEIQENLSATPRASTNLIDVYFISPDRVIAPRILNVAGAELRQIGAQRVSRRATADIDFVEARLDSARQQLTRSAASIRAFKQSPGYTNLSTQEQNLVTRVQTLDDQMRALDERRTALAEVEAELRGKGPRQADLAAVIAKLPEGANPEVRRITEQIQTKRTELRSLLTEEQLASGHPRVRFVESEMASLGEQLLDAVQASIRVLANQITEQRAEGDRIRRERQMFPDLQAQLQGLEEQRTIDQETFGFLQSQLYQAQITRAAIGPYVEIIDPATTANQIDPRGRMNVVLGALLGIILGVGAAFFLEYLDRTVRTSSDIETLLGIPVLGIIPRLRRLDAEGEDEKAQPANQPSIPLLVALDPLDPAAEAYRNLRMNLMFMSSEDEPIRSVLFTSAGPGEGKSTTTVNFAVMLAQQGQRVLLVDADLRRPSLHRALDLLREPGLTNLLVGDATVREAVRPSVLPNLDVLPSGPFPPNPSELLNSKAMKRLLEEFEGRYSQVIVDSPPMLAVTDAAVLAQHTDGVVLVLRSGETEQRAAERAVDQLRRLGVRVFGAVLNEVATTTTEESYYLQYYYAYQPRQDTGEEEGWAKLKKGLSRARFW